MKTNTKKNVMIISLLITVIFLSIGYAFLGIKLDNETLTTSLNVKWKVGITSITSIETEGRSKNLKTEVNGPSAAFDIYMEEKDEKIIYTINVKNTGTLDAKLDEIIITKKEENINYIVEGIKAGDVLKQGENVIFTLTLNYDKPKIKTIQKEENENDEEILLEKGIKDTVKIHLNYVQN